MERRLSNPLIKQTCNLVGAISNSMKNVNQVNVATGRGHEDGLLEEWPSARSATNNTLLADWPSNNAMDQIDRDLLKFAVEEANSSLKRYVEKDELDITLRKFTIPSANYKRKMNNWLRADDSITNTSVSSTASHDMLEDWPSSSHSSVNGDSVIERTALPRKNSLDFECVNSSLRALNIPSYEGADSSPRNREIIIKNKRLSQDVGMDKLGNYNRDDSATRLLATDMF